MAPAVTLDGDQEYLVPALSISAEHSLCIPFLAKKYSNCPVEEMRVGTIY
jgi:hypothetical protein